MRKHRRVMEIFKSYRLVSAKGRRIRRAAEILWLAARLDPWNAHRFMIPKECPLARTPNFLIRTQPLEGEGKGGGEIYD